MARSARDKYLTRKFGITQENYEAMLHAQKGACYVCERAPSVGRSLDVDHDHKTREIRGLLCHLCNRMLGLVRDPGHLVRARYYLAERFRSGWFVPEKKRKKKRSKK